MKKIIIVSLIVIALVALATALYLLVFPEENKIVNTPLEIQENNPIVQEETNIPAESTFKQITLEEIMDIIKTDKDYNDFSEFLKGFDPALLTYIQLGSSDYEKMKPEWQERGLESRIELIDKISLNDSTYWVEVANKKDDSKKLLAVLDIAEKKSLLLIASVSVQAGVGL